MDGNIDVRVSGQVRLLEASARLRVEIGSALIGRRFVSETDSGAIEMAALAARLLENDLSVDALAVACTLLRGRHISASCGDRQEFTDARLLGKLKPIARLEVGVEELVGKEILEVATAGARSRYFKFLPQKIDDGCVVSVQLMPHAAEALATHMANHTAPNDAALIVVRILELMQAATGKGSFLALPGRWFKAELAHVLGFKFDPSNNSDAIINTIIDDNLKFLRQHGIAVFQQWKRKKPAEAEGQGGEGNSGGAA